MTLRELGAASRYVRGLGDWGWFITLTFTKDVTKEHARWALKRWIRAMARQVVHGHIKMAWGFEETSLDRLHIHLVLECLENPRLFRPRLGRAMWKLTSMSGGISHFRKSRADQPGPEYVVKDGDWDVVIVCARKPRCRRAGCSCVVAKNHW